MFENKTVNSPEGVLISVCVIEMSMFNEPFLDPHIEHLPEISSVHGHRLAARRVSPWRSRLLIVSRQNLVEHQGR